MIGWHHRLNGHEFEQTPRDGEGQGSLACCGHGLAKSRTLLSARTTTTKGSGCVILFHAFFFYALRSIEHFSIFQGVLKFLH